jgi:hypothetical protein
MMPPRPTALRLLTRARRAQAPAPPLGLRMWSTNADAIAILLDAAGVDLDDPAQVATQIPHATDLPAATALFVFGAAARSRGMLRWLGRATKISRAARCTALVARGYVDIGAGTDDPSGADLAWGLSSPC